ncbi:MAG: hypothetical protein LBL43_03435 [Treponema sp.]|jgi:hypothetical protein|nr:hypothetical protein [Treponema sp.]
MTSYKNPPAVEDAVSFNEVLDRACEGLWDKKIRFSIRRLREMDAELLVMEKELDVLITQHLK